MNKLDPSTIKAPSEGEKALVESLRDYLKQCPYLPELSKFINVDYLGEKEDSFMIESVVAEPMVRRYLQGSVRQFQFYFASREMFSMDVLENISNSTFYERFAEWLEECTKARALPELSANRICQSVSAVTQGYVVDAQNTKAQYMIQCRMLYYQNY